MPVFVAHLTLSHFRSHQRTRLEFDGRPVALHGPNGSGYANYPCEGDFAILRHQPRGLRRGSRRDDMSRRPPDLGALGTAVRQRFLTPMATVLAETWPEPGSRGKVRIASKSAPQLWLGCVVFLNAMV